MADFETIGVFCGSASGNHPAYMNDAAKIGRMIAQMGKTLCYGGGDAGLMGEVARSAVNAGGKVVALTVEDMPQERPSFKVHQTVAYATISLRKKALLEKSDVFAVLPGGIGTLDELFELVCLKQIGRSEKHVAVLNTNGYWDGCVSMWKHMVKEGFIKKEHAGLLQVRQTPEELLKLF